MRLALSLLSIVWGVDCTLIIWNFVVPNLGNWSLLVSIPEFLLFYPGAQV